MSVTEGALSWSLKSALTINSKVSPPHLGLLEKSPSEKSSLSWPKWGNDNNIKIDRTTFFNIKDKNICQLKDTNLRSVNNKDVNLFFKNIYDDINNINNLKYNITNHVIECNNENKNEYMINVETFNTRFEPSNKDFYVKDLNKGGKLGPLKPYKNPQLKMRIF